MTFSCNKLVVIGAGLIGGSLIKALRAADCQIGEVLAVGRNLEVLKRAKQSGFIDAYSNDAATAVIGADVVIVGTPVGSIQQLLEAIYPNISTDCVISDVGSVKGYVSDVARLSLKEKVNNFIPAHPISGTEHSGFDASFAELFQGRFTILTPIEENDADQLNIIKQLWQDTGSQVLQMSVDSHDEIFAATSHLPHVLVYALMNTISRMENADKYFRVVAGGFLDYTRIASSDAVMWRDVCLTNSEPILEMIEKYKDQLTEFEQLIKKGDGDSIEQRFQLAKSVRDELVDQRLQQKQDSRS